MSDVISLITAIGLLVTALGSYIAGRAKVRSDTAAAKGDRIDSLESRMDAMRKDFDYEVKQRRKAELDKHNLRLALVTAIGYLDRFIKWADGGAKPPRPEADLEEIRSLLDADQDF